MWKRNPELVNLLHVVEAVRRHDDAGGGDIVVLYNSINTDDVDDVLVSQLLIKATYFYTDITTCFVALSSVMCAV